MLPSQYSLPHCLINSTSTPLHQCRNTALLLNNRKLWPFEEMDGDGMGMGIEMGMEMVGWAPTPHSPPPIGSSCVHW